MPFRPATSIAIAALVAMLAACNPVDTYRSIVGTDKNDPDPETTANTQNLAAGEKQPYPNLATVPSPPIPTMTQAERDKLTDSLIADRTNARYNEQKLLPGFAPGTMQPPPPPPPPAPLPGPGPAPNPGPMASTGPNAPPGPNAAPGTSSPPGLGAPPGPGASAASGPGGKASSAPPPRKPGEPAEQGPRESTLQMPQIKEAPQPETTRPPPPPPAPVMAPAPVPAARSVAPTAVASATPQPPPPPPAIPNTPPPPSPAPLAATPAAAPPKAPGHTVATIDFPAATANFTTADRVAIDKVAAQFRQQPGTVRVVAYAAAGSAGREQLDNYRAALDRGQAVAKALAEDGIPVGKIQTEAAPTRPTAPTGRVEIQLAP